MPTLSEATPPQCLIGVRTAGTSCRSSWGATGLRLRGYLRVGSEFERDRPAHSGEMREAVDRDARSDPFDERVGIHSERSSKRPQSPTSM
jgi:hypothetical protein